MTELLQESVRIYNLPWSVLLGLSLAYWILLILGFADVDGDGAPDLDVDLGSEGTGTADPGPVTGILTFLNASGCPLFFVLTLFGTTGWAASVLLNHHFNPAHSLLVAAGLLIPTLAASLVATRWLARPVQKLFRGLQTREDTETGVLGRICTVVSREANEAGGQAEVATRGAPILILVRTDSSKETIPKGGSAVVIRREENVYIIKPFED